MKISKDKIKDHSTPGVVLLERADTVILWMCQALLTPVFLRKRKKKKKVGKYQDLKWKLEDLELQ